MNAIETLETRRLMSASLSGGVLTVNGTDNIDNIDLSLSNGKIVVKRNNVVEGQFTATAVNSYKIYAKNGNDKVVLASNIYKPGTIEGGIGNDELRGGSGNETLKGGDGNDTLQGGKGNDQHFGGTGTDTIDYQFRTAALYIDIGNGGGQTDIGEWDGIAEDVENVIGGAGNDTINGSPQNNRLEGRGGNDTLFGEAGQDTLEGGEGNDTLIDFYGKTVLKGGNGNDTADYSQHSAGCNLSLDGVANDGESGEGDNIFSDVENITGGYGDDTIFGNANANTLKGGEGRDSIQGNGGADKLYGQGGNDFLFARDGVIDVVDGGAGTDKADIDWIYYPYGNGAKDTVSGIESYYPA